MGRYWFERRCEVFSADSVAAGRWNWGQPDPSTHRDALMAANARLAIGAGTHRRCTPALRMGTCVVFVNVDRGVAFQQARVNVDAWNGAEG
jgi:hypothetical protein